VNTVMNFLVPKYVGNFMCGCADVAFSRTRIHGFNQLFIFSFLHDSYSE
jgi:hypothetical protein